MLFNTTLPYLSATGTLQPYFDAEGGAGNSAGGSNEPTGAPKDGTEGNEPADDKNAGKGKSEAPRTYTDEELDDIIAKKIAKERAKHEKELEEAKKEAEKLAKMNADQKKEYEIEQLKQENEKLKATQVRSELSREAAKLLDAEGIQATQDMLDFVVASDAETTQSNIEKFTKIIKAQVEAAEVKRNTGDTPKNYSNTGAGLTKEEIMKEPDQKRRQQLISENMGLFK